MALISCLECKKKISSYAETCPQCGFPIAKWLADEARKAKPRELTPKQQKELDQLGPNDCTFPF